MKTVKWWLETGFHGCNHDGSFEVADDATDEEIEEEVRQAAFDRIEWGWTCEGKPE